MEPVDVGLLQIGSMASAMLALIAVIGFGWRFAHKISQIEEAVPTLVKKTDEVWTWCKVESKPGWKAIWNDPEDHKRLVQAIKELADANRRLAEILTAMNQDQKTIIENNKHTNQLLQTIVSGAMRPSHE